MRPVDHGLERPLRIPGKKEIGAASLAAMREIEGDLFTNPVLEVIGRLHHGIERGFLVFVKPPEDANSDSATGFSLR